MLEHLIIRCGLDETVDWLIESNGSITAGGQSVPLNTLQKPAGRYLTYVLVPTELVSLHHLHLPKMSPQRLAQAVPYALEDQFVEDIQTLHFAIGRAHADHPLTVATVKKEWLETWLQRFKECGLVIDGLMPEIFAVPYQPQHWTILLTTHMAYVRTQSDHGFATDPSTLGTLLQMDLDDEEAAHPLHIDIYSAETSQTPNELRLSGIPISQYPFDGNTLTFFAKELSLHPPAFNLLQGDYNTHREAAKAKKIWQIALLGFAAWAVMDLGFAVVQHMQLSHQNTALQTQIKTLYQKNMPGTSAMGDPQVQLEELIKNLSTAIEGGPFLSLLGATGKVLHNTPGLQLNNLTYQDTNLVLTLNVDNFNHLQALVQGLSAAGLSVKEDSAQTDSKGIVEAQLTISKTGATP